MLKTIIFCFIFFSIVTSSLSQKWERNKELTQPPLELFHSNYAVNLPSAEMLKSGDFFYSIAHRFRTPISSGANNLWGLDGSAVMRMNVGYAPSDDLFLNIGRTNQEGQFDFETKYKALEVREEDFGLPLLLSFLGGVTYNSKAARMENGSEVESGRLFQFYGMAILNTKIGESIGLGIAPSFLYNAHIQCPEVENSITLGTYATYYFNENWAIVAEANPTISGWRQYYDSYAVALELNTGGHFFKLLLSNNTAMNTSQVLGGAQSSFLTGNNSNLHLGFQITRVL